MFITDTSSACDYSTITNAETICALTLDKALLSANSESLYTLSTYPTTFRVFDASIKDVPRELL